MKTCDVARVTESAETEHATIYFTSHCELVGLLPHLFVSASVFMTGYAFVVNLVFVGPWSLLGFSMVIGSFFVLVSIE